LTLPASEKLKVTRNPGDVTTIARATPNLLIRSSVRFVRLIRRRPFSQV
jgi:hypothetical protein